MMKYYINLFKIELKKSIKVSLRYKFNTFFMIAFWAILMIILSFSLTNKHPEKSSFFIMSFAIWLLANNTFIAVVNSIISEATLGTLEQLYLNVKSFFGLLIVKGITASFITFIETSVSVILAYMLIPKINMALLAYFCKLLPILFISIFSLIGIGIACASIALHHKNISSFYSLVSSILFAILSYGVLTIRNNIPAMVIIPFAKATSTGQMFFQYHVQIPLNAYYITGLNGIIWLAIGFFVLQYQLKRAKATGTLSKF